MKWQQYACRFASTLVKEVLLDRVLFHPHGAGDKKQKMVKNMKNEKTNENRDNVAAIGIGAMIVFIALILVAAVAAAVIIQTAEKLQQNAQTTGQDTTDSMAARLFVVNVIVGGTNQLDVTFELAPGSDDVVTEDIQWTIVCAAGVDEDDLAILPAGATHIIGDTGTSSATIAAGNTYVTSLTTANCNPTANAEHTILFQAGGGGQTFEVLNYGGDVTAGAVVI
jgi:flagellin FlaB